MLLTNLEISDEKIACKLIHIKSIPVPIKKLPSLQLEFLSHDNHTITVQVQSGSLTYNEEAKEIMTGNHEFLTCYGNEYNIIKEQLSNPPVLNNKIQLVHVLSPEVEDESRKFNDLQVKAFATLRSEGYESIDNDVSGNPFALGNRKFVYIGTTKAFTEALHLLESQYPSLSFSSSTVMFETLTTWPMYSMYHSSVEANILTIYNYQNESTAVATLKSCMATLEKIAL